MSCFGCSRKYGLFCKEHGCPSCGYSYCAKCLKRPMAVPRHNNKIMNVCLICCDKLSKIQPEEPIIDCESLPGTIVTKSTARKSTIEENIDILLGATSLQTEIPNNLDDVLKPVSTITSEDSISENKSENTEINENLDSVISKRLKDLKTVDNLTSDDEIRSRLSNLTGMPQKDYSKKDLLLSTDERTDQEKMKDLLEQFAGEAQLDQRVDSDRKDAISDIERRLRALRGDNDSNVDSGAIPKTTFSPDTNTPSDNEQDDETMLKDIMQKYLAEARLPPGPTDEENELMASIPKPPAGVKPTDLEELPWCNVCNEDAVFRCKGCDGELFCAQCFRECHDDDEEYRAHEKIAYSAPPKFKENHF